MSDTDDTNSTASVDAFSIPEFCKRNGISVQLFYKNKTVMPATFRVGSRVLISREAAAQWRAERTAAENNSQGRK